MVAAGSGDVAAIASGGFTVIENGLVAFALLASVTVTLNGYVFAVVGVPLITADGLFCAAGLIVNPGGSEIWLEGSVGFTVKA